MIVIFLNDPSNEEYKFDTKNSMFQTGKQKKANTTKTILPNLRQKALNQVFVIILMHLVTANNDTDIAFKNCTTLYTCKTEINDVLID